MNLVRFRRTHAGTQRTMSNSLLSAIAVLAFGSAAAQALPVIPGGAGYGMETKAGRGGKVYKVTNLKASGAGSLKECIDGSGPRVCVFEVSGTIRLTSDLIVRNSYLTIAGQTAPSPGIMIRGAALRLQASELLIQHIRVRPGDDANGPDPDNRDALKIEGSSSKPVKNIVIDHCSFSWAIDEIASVWGPHDNITFSNNIFAEPLNESLHTDGNGKRVKHGFGVLLGSSASGGRVTMVGNLLAHQVERNPLSRARELVFVNNLVYNRVNMDLDLQTDHDRVTRNSVVGNVFIKGPSYDRNTRPIYVRTSGTYSLVSGAKVYVSDNSAPATGSALAQILSLTGGDVISNLVSTASAPVWNSGLTARKTKDNAVYNRVLKYAGARPITRDSVDKRIVADVKNRTGGIINCVASNGTSRCNRNAGGWPSLSQNTRKLTLPNNPNTISANGYTKLENWLHTLDWQLQGITSGQSPVSPATVSVN